MTKIYKRTDRIKLQIDDLVVTISPLTLDQKIEAKTLISQGKIKGDYKQLTDGIIHIMKHSVRDIKGLYNLDGTEYKLEFENDALSQDTIENLFNIELHKKLTMVCSNLLSSIPNSIVDDSGKPIEGVSFIQNEKSEEKSPN